MKSKINQNKCIASIVSANYIAYARNLAESISKNEPDCDFHILIVDRPTEQIKAEVETTGLNVTYAEELGINEFERIAFKYDLVELNTALKPTFIKKLFSQNYEKVIYLDPDIYLFSSLFPVFNSLDSNSIVLTPHTIRPIMDGKRPSDIDFLRNGVFNLGFIALKNNSYSNELLDWWEERCLHYGFNDTTLGIFVDQKWCNLVPCLFNEVYILKHPGCNVAYWNLHERIIKKKENSYLVNGKELCFFHFSGVKVDNPAILSTHQNRHEIVKGSLLEELVLDYCRLALSMGHRNYSQIKYTYGEFDNKRTITKEARRAACFSKQLTESFFSASSEFYKCLVKNRIIVSNKNKYENENTMNVNQNSNKIIFLNIIIRSITRLIGVNRTAALIKYITFLNREDNLSRVLMNQPFNLSHEAFKNS